ncbi:MAG: phosphonate metabolism protein/1,5-bisphosphokinase (PRPP-forming) PhnN [Paracoccus sp. (in: a-proteobacteria)]|uniref:phosphonate metabolism protein/1,5-bisphosphokinase (PRPP-forming) PhnN n=1 Tax=Paracoccus sp. TaxID=267 RepID=UPI0026E02BA8|nr:phosphonate metabolism protein/1,5-bisphosphokinase (PRPP-forming) PhnN [Paracoccus sp. (in: a-proteobacteria)]MDO5632830.1 phosphonate metabolism protein/1,5-bisphosphokinase (PRPP-forming) PhnN [Paracoccus sp. (in: a-proteobacteria)]
MSRPPPQIIAVVGLSGSGVSTLMKAAADRMAGRVSIVRRVITRPAEPGGEEIISTEERAFTALQKAGLLAVSWYAYGMSYGIPKKLPDAPVILANMSRLALAEAAAAFPGLAVIHVTAPEPLRIARLTAHGRDNPRELAARIGRGPDFDRLNLPVHDIDNSTDLETALDDFCNAIERICGA